MDKQESTEFIIKETQATAPPQRLIMDLCQKTGASWNRAAIRPEVEVEHRREITAARRRCWS